MTGVMKLIMTLILALIWVISYVTTLLVSQLYHNQSNGYSSSYIHKQYSGVTVAVLAKCYDRLIRLQMQQAVGICFYQSIHLTSSHAHRSPALSMLD
jgi:phage-related holin